jgi:RNAse (barnase) inhibitor barstar
MYQSNGFEFAAVSELPKTFEDALIGVIPEGLSTVDALFQQIAEVLLFPPYFGGNWNALYDCLRDFHWVKACEIVLIHSKLPRLPQGELVVYLQVLRDAVADWKSNESHRLRVIFDKSDERDVLAALSAE